MQNLTERVTVEVANGAVEMVRGVAEQSGVPERELWIVLVGAGMVVMAKSPDEFGKTIAAWRAFERGSDAVRD